MSSAGLTILYAAHHHETWAADGSAWPRPVTTTNQAHHAAYSPPKDKMEEGDPFHQCMIPPVRDSLKPCSRSTFVLSMSFPSLSSHERFMSYHFISPVPFILLPPQPCSGFYVPTICLALHVRREAADMEGGECTFGGGFYVRSSPLFPPTPHRTGPRMP